MCSHRTVAILEIWVQVILPPLILFLHQWASEPLNRTCRRHAGYRQRCWASKSPDASANIPPGAYSLANSSVPTAQKIASVVHRPMLYRIVCSQPSRAPWFSTHAQQRIAVAEYRANQPFGIYQSPSPNSAFQAGRCASKLACAPQLCVGVRTGSRVSSPQHRPTDPIRPAVQRHGRFRLMRRTAGHLPTQRLMPSVRMYQQRGSRSQGQ